MVDSNTRTGKRTPVTLKIKFKSETLEQFIERYAVDVSQGGIFIRTKEPLAVGTQMRFEFQLRDASPLIGGEGTVVWTRENDPSRPAIAPGMGVRFDRLAEGSQSVLERILAEKVKQAPQRSATDTARPPLFTDQPTRVAPAPVQDALLHNEKPRRRPDDGYNDQLTPLPKPMPFHSDADEFPDEAFEEATKVRALDELIAQTADGGNPLIPVIPPADELAARRGGRGDATITDPLVPSPAVSPLASASSTSIGVPKAPAGDLDLAPGLPSPPEPAPKPAPRLLDTTPSPRTDAAGLDAIDRAAIGTKTKLGLDPPRLGPQMGPAGPTMGAPSLKEAPGMVASVRAVAAEATTPTRRPVQRRSAAPLFILVLVLAAAAAAGVWFFVLREKAVENAGTPKGSGDVGSNKPVGSNGSAVALGSNGSAAEVGSNGSNGASQVGSDAPKVELAETVIVSSIEGSTVEIVGAKQTGQAPFTAKLEKNKDYKARVIAPGFATLELDIKGGQAQVVAKLVAKPRVIAVTSTPSGALIFVDGAPTGHSTPFEVELTKAQTAKKSLRVTLRKGGFKPIDKVVALDTFTEDAAKMVASVSETLTAQVYRPPPPDRGSAATGSNTNQGSNQTGSDGGTTGSATTPPPTGSATTPPPTGSATPPPTEPAKTGSGTEPEPGFVKP